MGELITSLSKTPLPTILAVAGIVFLFFAVGGKFGAQVLTDNIKQKYSAALGLLLMIAGLLLYIAPWMMSAPQPTILVGEASPGPRSGPASSSKPGGFILRRLSEEQGTVTQTESSWEIVNGTITMESKEQIHQGRASFFSESTTQTELVAVADGKPSVIRETILTDRERTVSELDGEREEEVDHGVLEGHVILIEMNGGRWRKTLLAARPTSAQEAELNTPYVYEGEFYPQESIGVGATWELRDEQLAGFMGMDNLLSIHGLVSFKLDEISKFEGENCALISFRFNLAGKTIERDASESVFEVGGAGVTYRSLSKFIDVHSTAHGVTKYTTPIIRNGRRFDLTIAGPIEFNEKVRLE